METDAFMDALAVTWKLQRLRAARASSPAPRHGDARSSGCPRGADVTELVNQVGGLQRELRELRRELEAR